MVVQKCVSKTPIIAQSSETIQIIHPNKYDLPIDVYDLPDVLLSILNVLVDLRVIGSILKPFTAFSPLFSVHIRITAFPVKVTITKRGHLRIYHMGFSYGQYRKYKTDQTRQKWRCTRNDSRSIRCAGCIETSIINDSTMMRFTNKHNCDPKI